MLRQSLAPALLSQKDKSTFLLFIVLIYFQNIFQLSLCFQTCFQRVFWKQWIIRLCFFDLNRGSNPAGIDWFKINEKNTAKLVEPVHNELTMKTAKQCQFLSLFVEHVIHLALAFLSLTWNRKSTRISI